MSGTSNFRRLRATRRERETRRALKTPRIFVLALLILTGISLPVTPLDASAEVSRGSLVSEMMGVVPGSTFLVALLLDMDDGWHTYWRNPGDSGQPPEIEWLLPDGFQAGEILWPHPERMRYGTLMNYGFENRVLLQVPITAPVWYGPDRSFVVRAEARWLVCREICIPQEGRFELEMRSVEKDPLVNEQWQALFGAARDALPAPFPEVIRYSADAEELTISIPRTHLTSREIDRVWIYPYEWGIIDHASAQRMTVSAGEVTLRIHRGDRRYEPIEAFSGVLVIEERIESGVAEQAFEFSARKQEDES
jgi:thiol:disulfide interchange protein DsbD